MQMYQDGVISRRLPFEQSSDFIDDELPLPSFQDVFGFSVPPPMINKAQKRRFSGSEGMDPRALAKRLKLDDFEKGSKHDSGRWTSEEHRLFLEGVMLYGKDWKKMQPLIKTRSLVQIRTHAQKVFKKIGLKRFEDSYDEKPVRLPPSSTETAASVGNTNQSSDTALPAGEAKTENDESDEKANDNSVNVSSTAEDRNATTSNPQRSSSVSASNDFRGYDMEVTDEEFNLVVQHLKNLGEIRGDDFSDEGEEGSINDHGRTNAKKQRAVATATSSSGRNQGPDQAESSNTPAHASSSSNSFESSDVDSRPNPREEDTTDKTRSTGNPPFIQDDDAQSQHLLQTLRQYLMPDSENNDGFSATEFF